MFKWSADHLSASMAF
jgi:hypothetical protein